MSVKDNKNKKANPVSAFLWKNKKRRAKNLYFLLVVVLCIITVGMGFIYEKLDLMATGDDNLVTDNQGNITSEIIFEE